MPRSYWVYLITDKPFGTLYIGVTSDLHRRMCEHRNGQFDGFSKRYGLKKLVWCEEFGQVHEALAAEKKIKNWQRAWKIDLIKKMNPEWHDMAETQ